MTDAARASLKKRFSVPAEKVFDAWLDPSWISRWMFGPSVRDESVVRLSVEPRVGGTFSFVVNRGGQEVEHIGEYLEIERPRRLAFTWATRETVNETSRVTIEIEALDGECELTLVHEMPPKWAAFTEKAAGSWQHMLDVLGGVLGCAG